MQNTRTYPLAPVCLFVYKRLDTLRKTVESLLLNKEAAETDVYIFSDAAACEPDIAAVNEVRSFITRIQGFKSITCNMSTVNCGLAKSVISGVSAVLSEAGNVIVLEDDLVVSGNFLSFMNQALDYYKNNKKMFSVAGYTMPVKTSAAADVYFTKRASCWGWATWQNRWDDIDWNVNDYSRFANDRLRQKQFNKMGSDLSGMLKKQMTGKINSWAIRWTYEQFKKDLYTVFPTASKVMNEGFGGSATHTDKTMRTRFYTMLDRSGQENFNFPEQPFLSPAILKQFTARYSIKTRVYYKLKSFLN